MRTVAYLECCPLCIEVIKQTKSETHDTVNVTTRYCSGAWWFVWFTSCFKFDFSWHTVSGFRRPASTYVILNRFIFVTDWPSTCFWNLSCAHRASLLSFVVLSFRSPFSISGKFFQSPYFVISSVIFSRRLTFLFLFSWCSLISSSCFLFLSARIASDRSWNFFRRSKPEHLAVRTRSSVVCLSLSSNHWLILLVTIWKETST